MTGDKKSTTMENTSDHKAAISLLLPSPDGGRLLSSDDSGVIVVWRLDGGGRFSRLHRYPEAAAGSRITRAVWVSSRIADGTGGTTSLVAFFAGTEGGWLVYGDDQGNCNRVGGDFRAAIDILKFDPASRRMVVITRDMAMAVLDVAQDGKMALVTRAKLSVRASRGVTSAAWLGNGVLCTATAEEPAARVWMVGKEDTGASFILKLASLGRDVPRSDKVAAVAFLSNRSIMALGTVEGRVLLLRRVAAAATSSASPPGSPARGGAAASSPSRSGLEAPSARRRPGADDWRLMQQLQLSPGITALDWSSSKALLVVSHSTGASVLQQVPMRRVLRWPVAVGQTGVNTLLVQTAASSSAGRSARLAVVSPINIKGLDASQNTLIVHNNKAIAVFDIAASSAAAAGMASPSPARLLNRFPASCSDAVVYGAAQKSGENDTIIAAAASALLFLNRDGIIKHTLPVAATDGSPVCLARRDRFVAMATDAGALKVVDASRAEPRVVHEGRFDHPGTGYPIGLVHRMAISADGRRIALLCSRRVAGGSASAGAEVLEADSRVHVWTASTSLVASFDCGRDRLPVDVSWDDAEARLLAVQTESGSASAGDDVLDGADGAEASNVDASDAGAAAVASFEGIGTEASRQRGAASGSGVGGDPASGAGAVGSSEVVTVFVTPDGRLLRHDSITLSPPLEAMLGLRVPDIVFMTSGGDESTDSAAAASSGPVAPGMTSRPLRDFVGLEDAPPETKRALLEFSYQLALGNMDAAFAAVKGVDAFGVWRSMASMCVKSRRLDVAAVCLSNMGHVRGVRALRQAAAEPEEEARVAMVAVQLGLLPDAAKLYQAAGRHDLLNQLLQACGEWDKALAVASASDRIHERTTHFKYAAHLEALGDVGGAVTHYEHAGTGSKDVPRMLAVKGRFGDLRDYVKSKSDKDLTRWLGQFALSQGNGDLAAKLFNEAGAAFDLTRLLCLRKEFASASRLVQETRDVPSAVHLARQLKLLGRHAEAIKHLEDVGCFDHATRIAIDAGLDTEVVTLALRADSAAQRAAAAYFREQGDLGRAVQLLRKAGDLAGALTLCFEGELFDDLAAVADELAKHSAASASDGTSAPVPTSTLKRCADFFAEHGQHSKAVSMLLHSRKLEEALELAEAHKVPLTATMADALVLPREAPEGVPAAAHKDRRQELLMRAARLLRKQEAFQLATKMYTQAGDTVKAMRCLIKSGDKEKIMVFAGVSRSKEIYVLAANFLQSLDWRTDSEVMKAIISFYTKARAWEQLSGFFDACAQVEIDEFRNYDKAVGAMGEAKKFAGKIKDGKLGALQSVRTIFPHTPQGNWLALCSVDA